MQFLGLMLVQAELSPQINSSYLIISRQAVGCAAFENHSAVDDVGPVGDAERFPHVMVGDEHADPPFLQ